MSMSDPIRVWIRAELAEKVRRHGEETYPHECCGALLGRDGNSEGRPEREILELYPLVNRREDSPRTRFSVAPGSSGKAERVRPRARLAVVQLHHRERAKGGRGRDDFLAITG